MDRFEFYKEFYFREEDKKNEINNSLSFPTGVISGLIAGIFYLLTTFDFKLGSLTIIFFVIAILATLIFLAISIFHLINSYSNIHNGFEYAYLADTNDLENYYKQLDAYYADNLADTSSTTEKDFKQYIFEELVKNTDINQKNNKVKSFHRHKCQSHLVTTIFLFCVSLFPFGYNFASKQSNKEIVSGRIKTPLEMKLNSKENYNFIDSLFLNQQKMADDKKPPIPKPTPPKSQLIKEGLDPKIKPQTQTPPPKTKPEKK